MVQVSIQVSLCWRGFAVAKVMVKELRRRVVGCIFRWIWLELEIGARIHEVREWDSN